MLPPLDANGCPNPDGEITVGDALVILRVALGLVVFDGGEEDRVIYSETSAAEIAEISMNDDETVSLTTTSDSSLGESFEVDSLIIIAPGIDDRFPFGVSGNVSSITNNSDGSVMATLEEVTLADVVDETYQETIIGLNADNFIGVIAPSSTQATQAMQYPRSVTSYGGTKYAINGGVIVKNSTTSYERAVTEVTELGNVELNLTVYLDDMGIDVSNIDPNAAFVISGSLQNLMLKHLVDFDLTSGLNELDLVVTGEINIESKLTTNGSITLGYYHDAWQEVEDVQVSLIGITGKLTGLDSKDKIGKFPLVGLVWSTSCPNTCPTNLGNTQTPVDLAKLGGVIVWVYLDAEGTITLEGAIGSRVNADFSIGVKKPESGALDVVYSLTKSGDGRLLEMPFISGSVGFDARAGISLDVDAFVLGVRLANASAQMAANISTDIEGELSYGIDALGEEWSWEGSACMTTNYGAGLILSASVNAGVEIDCLWLPDVEFDYSYYGQWPTEEEIETPGWHGIGDLTWYTADIVYKCFTSCITPQTPTLSVSKTEVNGGETYTVSWNSVSNATRYLIQESTKSNFSGATNSYTTSTSKQFSHSVSTDTRYYYRVKADNEPCDVESGYSSSKNVLVKNCITPQTPTLSVSKTEVNSGETYTVSWNSVSNATRYLIQESTKSNFSGATSFTINSPTTSKQFSHTVSSDTRYYYQVKAENGPCNLSSKYSNSKNVLVKNCITPQTPTLSVSKTEVNEGETYTVSWNPMDNASGYILQESTTSNFSGATSFTINSPTTSKQFSHTVSSDTRYYYQVKAENGPCNLSSKYSNSKNVLVKNCITPQTPTLSVSKTEVNEGDTYTVSWNSVANATRYLIQESTKSNFSGATNSYTTSTSKQFSHSVSTDTRYYYRVVADNEPCGLSSKYSNSKNVLVRADQCAYNTPPTAHSVSLYGYGDSNQLCVGDYFAFTANGSDPDTAQDIETIHARIKNMSTGAQYTETFDAYPQGSSTSFTATRVLSRTVGYVGR